MSYEDIQGKARSVANELKITGKKVGNKFYETKQAEFEEVYHSLPETTRCLRREEASLPEVHY